MASGLSGGGRTTGTLSGRPSICWLFGTCCCEGLPPATAAAVGCCCVFAPAAGAGCAGLLGRSSASSIVFAPDPQHPPCNVRGRACRSVV